MADEEPDMKRRLKRHFWTSSRIFMLFLFILGFVLGSYISINYLSPLLNQSISEENSQLKAQVSLLSEQVDSLLLELQKYKENVYLVNGKITLSEDFKYSSHELASEIGVYYYKENPVGYGPPTGELITTTPTSWTYTGISSLATPEETKGSYSIKFVLPEKSAKIVLFMEPCDWKTLDVQAGQTYSADLVFGSLCPPGAYKPSRTTISGTITLSEQYFKQASQYPSEVGVNYYNESGQKTACTEPIGEQIASAPINWNDANIGSYSLQFVLPADKTNAKIVVWVQAYDYQLSQYKTLEVEPAKTYPQDFLLNTFCVP